MKSLAWWRPGLDYGLLSRSWAQVLVFPLPTLARADLESSLRYKAKASLPSHDEVIRTRFYRFGGQLYGIALIDRLPAEQPPADGLFVGMPLRLPSSWVPAILLAVLTPDGWEVHRYEGRVLVESYPPVPASSPVLGQLRTKFPGLPAWAMRVAGESAIDFPNPEGFDLAPRWPSHQEWGIPWKAPAKGGWHRFVGGGLAALGLALSVLGALNIWHEKELRNMGWSAWLEQSRALIANQSPSKDQKDAKNRAGVPLEAALTTLGRAWSTGVEIVRFDLSNGTLRLTARATSALEAIARVAESTQLSSVKVVQIRAQGALEEFDLEGTWNDDQ